MTAEFINIVDNLDGTYLDYNSGTCSFVNKLIPKTGKIRKYTLVDDLSTKKNFRTMTDTVNKVINEKKGPAGVQDKTPLADLLKGDNVRILRLGTGSKVKELELALKELSDNSVVVIEEDVYNLDFEEFLHYHKLEAKFVYEYNFYYIIKGIESRKGTNTLATPLGKKVERSRSKLT